MLKWIFNSAKKHVLKLSLIFCSNFALAATATSAGSAASTITNNIASVTKLITAGAYVTGAAMFFIAIFQFRQHKENPTQTPLSKPMMFLGIAAALLFFPTLVSITEGTVFGPGAKTATAQGTDVLS